MSFFSQVTLTRRLGVFGRGPPDRLTSGDTGLQWGKATQGDLITVSFISMHTLRGRSPSE